MVIERPPLYLNECDFYCLFRNLGPSLGLWRAAEVAVLREQVYDPPVLDLGCGDGFVTGMVLRHVSVGIDPDPSALDRARRRGLYERVEPVAVEDSGLPPGSVRTIVSNSVLEHVPHLDEALEAAARLLCPGGRLVFTAPTEAFSRWLALPGEGYASRRNRHFAHINLLSLEEWSRRLDWVGLAVEQVRPYLKADLVNLWDWLELAQLPRFGRKRLFGLVWRRLPERVVRAFARRAATVDLSAPEPGGGRLIAARKRG